MPSTRLLALPALVLALALPACGGDDDDDPGTPASGGGGTEAAQLTQALKDYNQAFGSGDYSRMCELMTNAARKDFMDAASKAGAGDDCPKALDKAIGSIPEQERERVKKLLTEAKISGVQVDGNSGSAQLTLSSDGQTQQTRYPLSKEGGQWKVQQNPGVGG